MYVTLFALFETVRLFGLESAINVTADDTKRRVSVPEFTLKSAEGLVKLAVLTVVPWTHRKFAR